ncbi:MAG: MaoC family dehydratase [Actinomycetales bacterium]
MASVQQAPSLPRLFARAALLGRGQKGGDSASLPTRRVRRSGVRVEGGRLARYDTLCGYPLADTLPVTGPHLLTFPMQVQLMAARDFPLALVGLVHVRNEIRQHRPVGVSELLDLEVWAERLASHPRGATADLCALVSVGGETVWESRSVYLSRGATAPAGASEADVAAGLPTAAEVEAAATGHAVWKVPGDLGRRYASVSGDVNPIHLWPLTAKAFGFPRAIAHGMWTHARSLAALSGRLPDALVAEVAFRKPVLLPSTVLLATAPGDGGWDLAVTSRGASRSDRQPATPRAPIEHLVGTVRGL